MQCQLHMSTPSQTGTFKFPPIFQPVLSISFSLGAESQPSQKKGRASGTCLPSRLSAQETLSPSDPGMSFVEGSPFLGKGSLGTSASPQTSNKAKINEAILGLQFLQDTRRFPRAPGTEAVFRHLVAEGHDLRRRRPALSDTHVHRAVCRQKKDYLYVYIYDF